MTFEDVVVPEDWRSGKGERNECKNYGGITMLSVVGEIYAGILVDRVRSDWGFD